MIPGQSIMSGIAERIAVSDRFQEKFNIGWTKEKREKAFFRHNNIMARLVNHHALDSQCRDCSCVLDRFFEENLPCPECGSMDIASPYFC